MSDKQNRISIAALSEIQAALKAYCAEMENSDLSYASQAMYIDFADCFVRWLQGEYAPRYHKTPVRNKDKTPSGGPTSSVA